MYIINGNTCTYGSCEILCKKYFKLFIDLREKGGERESDGQRGRERMTDRLTDIDLSHVHIHCLLLYVPWPEIKPSTMVYWDDTLTKSAT